MLIQAYRDSLDGYIITDRDGASKYVKTMLRSKYQTIQRLAIYEIGRNFYLFADILEEILDGRYLDNNYRHEVWHFLKKNYHSFSDLQRRTIIAIISNIIRYDDKGVYHIGASSYAKATWLSAIRDYSEKEEQLYAESTGIAKIEPDPPDFSIYKWSRKGGRKSPKTLEELQALSIEDIIDYLSNYKESERFDEPGLEGLV